jgi:GNAT superfamily N-acetyltransferase
MVPGDLPYVYSTWLRDLRDADGGPLPDDLFFMAHRGFIDQLLADESVVALVACAAEAPDEILGYCVAEPGETLLWVQVKKPLRGRGLAKRLLVEAKVPPGTAAAWSTPLSRDHLQNPPRGRRVRRNRAMKARVQQPSVSGSGS